MNIHLNLDDIDSVREHSDRKARAAMLDMLGEQITAKFGVPLKVVKSRLSDLGDEEIKSVALRFIEASSFDELLTPGGVLKP